MSLLDGKYEIISQSALDGGRTLFEGTAPDGTAVRIEWFDLEPAKEPVFERYRRLLKRLKRDGRAAVYDVISRPGAHYVAWERPDGTHPAGPDAELAAALADEGYAMGAADVRRNGRNPRLYGLAWDGSTPPKPSEPEAVLPPPTPRSAAARLGTVPPWVRSWGSTVLLLGTTVLLLVGGFQRRANDTLVTVPGLAGANVNDAADRLYRLHLAVTMAPLGSTDAPGTVLSSDPPAGAQLRPGRVVRLAYALPQGRLAPADAPQLVGTMFPDDTLRALRASGLELGEAAHIHAGSPAGVVLSQTVPAGSTVGRGQSVDVLVSAGPSQPMTFLPRLVGLSIDDARYLAGLAGLGADHVLEDPVSAPNGAPGEVLSQSLAPYEPVPTAEATLRLVVQQGTPTAATGGAPSLVGMSAQDAATAAAGYHLETATIATTSLPEGVVEQDPPPGAAVGDGTLKVTLNVHPVSLVPPAVRATVKRPQLRSVPYAWSIQPGIGRQSADVYAKPLDGTRTLVQHTTVAGGDVLKGSWLTTYPGPVTFYLYLSGQPYGEALFVP